ncbi:hypothetical protein BU15DRAFT_59303 [Melanogaster broomeanus]|nr:hypothetical protein BU15DRAFT_59303 [Melanogaster broomeanus]
MYGNKTRGWKRDREKLEEDSRAYSKLPRSLRGSLRGSTHSFDPSRLFARAFPRTTNSRLFGKRHSVPVKEEELSSPLDDGSGDFELINSDDIPPEPQLDHPTTLPEFSHTLAEDHNLPSPSIVESSTPAPPQPSVARPKSTLFRLKNFSKIAEDSSRTATNESDLYLAFPKPPTHIPTSGTSAHLDLSAPSERATFSSDLTVNTDQEVTLLLDSCTKPESTSVDVLPEHAEPSSSEPTNPRRKFTGSLKRFKSLSQLLRDSLVTHTADASSINTIRSKKRWHRKRDFDYSESVSSDPTTPVAELPLNPAHPSSPSFIADEAGSNSSLTVSTSSLPDDSSPETPPLPRPLRRKHSAPADLGRVSSSVTHYEFVNPYELTTSPSPLASSSLVNSSARSSFLPPSPSWLSRNVHHTSDSSTIFTPSRISALSDPDHLKITEVTTFYPSALFAPNSPRPLPVPPPILPVPPPQSRRCTASPDRPTLQRLVTDIYPASPESDVDSFVTSPTPPDSTLYSPTSSTTPTTAFASALPSPSPQFHCRLPNLQSGIRRTPPAFHRET